MLMVLSTLVVSNEVFGRVLSVSLSAVEASYFVDCCL